MLRQEIKAYYAELGFDESELLYLPTYVFKNYVKESWRIASSAVFAIEMPEFEVDDPDIKLLIFMDVLGHETYHSVAPFKFLFNRQRNHVYPVGTGMAVVETGKEIRKLEDEEELDYSNWKFDGVLEEGYALLFQERFFRKARENIPREKLERYDEMIKLVRDKIGGWRKIQLLKLTKSKLKFTSHEYPACLEVIEFLEEKIPRFRFMVEQARIRHNSMELAKACASTFGDSGAYRRIVTTLPTRAAVDDLMEYLQGKLSLKNG